MALFKLKAYEFNSPLRVKFQHASAARDQTQTVIILARGVGPASEQVGIGECCPREYVTGESKASVMAFFSAHKTDLQDDIRSLSDLTAWMQTHEGDIDENPAAFAALEGAIVDFLARQSGQTLEAYLRLPELAGRFGYSAILGDSRPTRFWIQAALYFLIGFRDFKAKLSGDIERDRAKLSVFRLFGKIAAIRLRADANNLWPDAQSCIDFVPRLNVPIWAIEEPVAADDYDAHAAIARELGVRIVLDESLLRIAQLEKVRAHRGIAIANVRISKNGGLLRSLALAKAAAGLDIPLIFGAHVGETSVLTRAALAIANTCQDHVVAREGAFGKLLLRVEPVSPSLRFGWRGVLVAKRVLSPDHNGTGLQILPEFLTEIG